MTKKLKIRIYLGDKESITLNEAKKFADKLKEKSGKEPEIEIIAVTENPSKAEEDNIMVTPTVIKISPEPVIKIVGDFPDKDKIWKKILKGV